eukprot:1153173-Pelagomonas_calceolata.AAC.3
MHGAGHNLSCQLQNCGRFTEGAGRCAGGEQCEQMWALLKALAARLRFMSPDRRQDLLSCKFADIQEHKHEKLVQHLQATVKKTIELKSELSGLACLL